MKTFLAVFNALPAILQSVVAVEAAFPLPKAGRHKLNVILGSAAAAWEASRGAGQLSKNDTLNMIQTLTSVAVAGMNAAGVFKASGEPIEKPSEPAAPAPPVSSN